VREADGAIVYLGRLDDQLKIRGYRVEPREIEVAISAIPGVSAAVVIPRRVAGTPRLVAYVICGSGGPEPAAIRERLRAELPAYLIPSRVVPVERFPLTRAGKLDRSGLPDPFSPPPDADSASAVVDADATDDLGVAIADIWRDVLGLEFIEPDESFFDAGGDSLMAVRLYGAVQRRFGVVLPGGLVNEELTLPNFIRAVREAQRQHSPPIVIELSTTEGPAVVLVPAGNGELYYYRWLIQALARRFHLVGMREPGQYGTEPRPKSLEDLSAACVRALREAGFEQPAAVIGASAGGFLALRLAYDLRRDADAPRLVALLDAPVPGTELPDAKTSPTGVGRFTSLWRRRRNAVALVRWRASLLLYRFRKIPAPPDAARLMTMRANLRRLRKAQPPFFTGRMLYMRATHSDEMAQAPSPSEYWSQFAASFDLVEVPGSHDGADGFLSPARVDIAAEALAQELAAALQPEVP
jgi:thioesterase domain-containing protein/acyl carrier protein